MRIEQLTFTRFIAAIAIVIFHFGKGIYPFGSGLLSTIINNANVAVSYFFTLSGFVMIIAYGASNKMINARKYYINRVAKIYPVYFLSLLLMLCNAHDLSYSKLLAEFFLIHSFLYQPTYRRIIYQTGHYRSRLFFIFLFLCYLTCFI